MDGTGDAWIPWAESVWGRRIAGVSQLTGGWTSTILRLTDGGGERAVLRLLTRQPWRHHAVGLSTREATVQQQLGVTVTPVLRSIALDVTGAEAEPRRT